MANFVDLTPTALTGANDGPAYNWGGGPGVVVFYMPTAGGSTVKLQITPDGTNYVDLNGLTTTVSKAFWFDDIPISTIRATTTGGAGATIKVYIQGVWRH